MSNVAAGLPNRGHTYHGGTPTSIGRSVSLEGTEVHFEDDVVVNGGPNTKRSGRTTLMRLVRNASGITLEPKRSVVWKTGFRGTRVDGYVATTAGEVAGVVDDQLGASGVANNDLFWIARKGPALVKNDIASGAGTVIAEGALVVALTAVTSQATTAGRVASGSAATSSHVLNRIGKAMSAKTTANTNADVLVDLDILN